MSVRFSAANQGYSSTTGLPSTTWTVTMWLYLSTDRNDFSTFLQFSDATNNIWGETDSDGTALFFDTNAGGIAGGGTFTASQWHRVALVANGASSAIYFGGSDGDAGLTLTNGTLSSIPTPTSMQVGRNSDPNFWWNGRMAALKVWSVALTQAEITAELNQFAPVRTSNLVRYHPFHIAEVTDYSGNSNALTAGVGAATTEAEPPIVDVAPRKIADRGSVADTAASATTAVDMAAAGSITVGNYLIARVATDNTGASGAATTLSAADTRSNTWTVLGPANVDPGAASAGATCWIAYTKVANAYTNGDDITFTHGVAPTADSIVIEEWTGIHAASPVAVAATTATGTSTTPSIARNPTAVGQLVYTALATEGPLADSFTNDSDVTDGAWIALTRQGGVDATATNNQTVGGAYKIVTGTAAQSWDATITSRDWAALALVFDVIPVVSAVPRSAQRRLPPFGALLDL